MSRNYNICHLNKLMKLFSIISNSTIITSMKLEKVWFKFVDPCEGRQTGFIGTLWFAGESLHFGVNTPVTRWNSTFLFYLGPGDETIFLSLSFNDCCTRLLVVMTWYGQWYTAEIILWLVWLTKSRNWNILKSFLNLHYLNIYHCPRCSENKKKRFSAACGAFKMHDENGKQIHEKTLCYVFSSQAA